MKWRRDILPPLVLLISLVLAWYFVAWVSGLDSFVLPDPAEVAQAGWEDRGLLLSQARYNSRVAAIDAPGLSAIGLVAGLQSFKPSAQTEREVAKQTNVLLARGPKGRAVLHDIASTCRASTRTCAPTDRRTRRTPAPTSTRSTR